MTAQQRTRVTWAAVVGAIAAAASIGTALIAGTRGLAKAAAVEQVSPVADRVTRLEAQRAEDVERQKEMQKDLKFLIRRLVPRDHGRPDPDDK